MMYKPLVRGLLALIGVAAATAPTTSEACWLTHCFSCCKPKPVTYCPPPAPAAEVCPQQVSYVPQTCYRAVETCVPCTTCRAETVCDPCTGPQTVMRPVTTYVRRKVMVPYTTYRPVVTPVAATSACCTGAAYNSPYYSGAAVTTVAPAIATTPAGCTNCATGYAAPATTPMYSSTPTYSSTPAYSSTPSTTYGAPITTQPQLPSGTPTPAAPSTTTPNGAPQQTFENGATQNGTGSSSSYYPIPDASRMQNAPLFNSGTPGAPALGNPNSSDRTTARPLYRAASILPAMFGSLAPKTNLVKTISATRNTEPAAPPVDDGWRPLGGR